MKQQTAVAQTSLVIFFIVVICSSLSHGQVKSRDGKLEISKYGTPKKMRSADGKERKLSVGYFVGYRFTNPKTSKEEEKFLSAVGDERSRELEEVRTEQVATVNNTAKTSVRAKDGVLRLDHKLTLDNSGGKLENKIVIRNTSSKPVQLTLVKIGTDSWLAGGGREILKQPLKDLGPLVQRITGAVFSLGDCQASICVPPPPCLVPPICVPDSERLFSANVIVRDADSSWREFETSRTGPSDSLLILRKKKDYVVTLYWRDSENLKGVWLSPNEVVTIIVHYRAG